MTDEDPGGSDTAFFARLVEEASDAIVVVDGESRVLYANAAVEDVLGYPPDELVGDPLTAVLPDRFRDQMLGAIGDRRRTAGGSGETPGNPGGNVGEPVGTISDSDRPSVRYQAEHADGRRVTVSVSLADHTYDGQPVCSAVIRRIADRAEYDTTLETLQETAQQLMPARSKEEIGEIVVGAATEILSFPAAAVYRYDGTNDVLRPDTRAGNDLHGVGDRDLLRSAFEAGSSRSLTSEDATISGVDAGVTELLAMPMGQQGVVVVAGARERHFAAREVELAHLLAANAEAAYNRADREARLQRQNERLERFASIVSHDLRDPLNSARAQITLLRAEHDSEYVGELEAIVDRMEELVEDVLELTKQGRTVGDPTEVDLASVVEDAWTTASPNGEAELELEGDLGTLLANEERLRTLFENLLGNAVHHAGPDVTVTVGRLDGGEGFFVADDGPGIPPDEREKVLDYGYTSADEGTGLGLNIVTEIATAHGWSTEVTGSEPGGARFEFEFESPTHHVTND